MENTNRHTTKFVKNNYLHCHITSSSNDNRFLNRSHCLIIIMFLQLILLVDCIKVRHWYGYMCKKDISRTHTHTLTSTASTMMILIKTSVDSTSARQTSTIQSRMYINNNAKYWRTTWNWVLLVLRLGEMRLWCANKTDITATIVGHTQTQQMDYYYCKTFSSF